jgi:putative hemolysin
MHRQKPDMDILEQNRALLQNELGLPVEASIDKKANVTIGKKCAYCGKDGGQKKLSKCSDCKSIYYCTVEHQRKHWKAHRPECRRIVSSKTAKAGAT